MRAGGLGTFEMRDVDTVDDLQVTGQGALEQFDRPDLERFRQ